MGVVATADLDTVPRAGPAYPYDYNNASMTWAGTNQQAQVSISDGPCSLHAGSQSLPVMMRAAIKTCHARNLSAIFHADSEGHGPL